MYRQHNFKINKFEFVWANETIAFAAILASLSVTKIQFSPIKPHQDNDSV